VLVQVYGKRVKWSSEHWRACHDDTQPQTTFNTLAYFRSLPPTDSPISFNTHFQLMHSYTWPVSFSMVSFFYLPTDPYNNTHIAHGRCTLLFLLSGHWVLRTLHAWCACAAVCTLNSTQYACVVLLPPNHQSPCTSSDPNSLLQQLTLHKIIHI